MAAAGGNYVNGDTSIEQHGFVRTPQIVKKPLSLCKRYARPSCGTASENEKQAIHPRPTNKIRNPGVK